MNIFILDYDVQLCAKYHCDKHVVKMILETAQLLCSAHESAPYKRTHYNHPCAVWTRNSLANYDYLAELGLALASEYTHRYGKRHKSQDVIEWCQERVPYDILEKDSGLTPFVQAMPDELKNSCAVTAYRNYYRAKDISKTYTKRNVPEFLK